jgi:hypothetical protein
MRLFIFIALASMALCSCRKLAEYYNIERPTDDSKCRIREIVWYESDGVTKSHWMEFEYEPSGRLDGVYEQYAGNPEEIFPDYWEYVYDSLGRLVFVGPFSTQRPFATSYGYIGNSRLPATDTVWVMGGPYVEHFEYDERGRVIKVSNTEYFNDETGQYYPVESEPRRFYYDFRGNRQEHPENSYYQGPIKYTEEPSLYTLDPAFQLQYLNWSQNATMKAGSHNEHGWPTTYIESYHNEYSTPFQELIAMYNPGYTVVYDCE